MEIKQSYRERVVISLLVYNHFGVLQRITGLFAGRGFNIETVATGLTEDRRQSRVTITTSGDENIINQIKLQLAKLEDVEIVQEINETQLFIREVILIKVEPRDEQMDSFENVVADFGGRCQIIERSCCIIELTATPATVDAFVHIMREYNIKEISRTGGCALQLSTDTVY